jgi:hypothetical protein
MLSAESAAGKVRSLLLLLCCYRVEFYGADIKYPSMVSVSRGVGLDATANHQQS